MIVKCFSGASLFHIVDLLRGMSHKSGEPHETEKDRTLRLLDGNIVVRSVKNKEPEAEQAPQRITTSCHFRRSLLREVWR